MSARPAARASAALAPVPRHVLVLRGGAIGDFIVTLPALAALRAQWPSARLWVAGYPRAARLALEAGLCESLRSLDDAAAALLFAPSPLDPAAAQRLRAYVGPADLAVSFLHDPDARVAERLREAGIPRVHVCSPDPAAMPAADALALALRPLGVAVAPPCVPRLPVPPAWRAAAAPLWPAGPLPVVTLHPGSGSAAKNWPLAGFAALARSLVQDAAAQPLFVLGDAEQSLLAELRAAAPGMPVVADAALTTVAGLLARARLHVGNDSGLAHLAGAVGTPVVALFGPSDPAIWAPRGPRVQVLLAPGRAMADLSVAAVRAACAASGLSP